MASLSYRRKVVEAAVDLQKLALPGGLLVALLDVFGQLGELL